MQPMFFGDGNAPLYGVYHPPVGEARDQGVVICPPVGHEYLRTHRALRQLADRLARAGIHVLRFDYFGTGDSAGDGRDVDLAHWRADVATAVDALRRTAGVSRVSLMGVRLGATLAILAAADGTGVRDLVLWDPVVDGPAYLEALEAMHGAMLSHPDYYLVSRTPAEATTPEWLGFPYPPALTAGLRALRLKTVTPAVQRATLLLSQPSETTEALREWLTAAGVSVHREGNVEPGDWDDVERIRFALLPGRLVSLMCNHLIQEAA